MVSVSPSIRMQSVFFEPDAATLDRYWRGIRQSVRTLHQAHDDVVIDLRVSDCSPSPALAGQAITDATTSLTAAGIRSFNYQFENANLGHGGAQNQLLRDRGDAEFVLILNPDTCLSPRALTELYQATVEPTVGIVEARQLPLEHQKAFDLTTGETSWASGACSLIRKAVFDAIGGYDDTTFFLHCDDVDFSWRCRLAGFRVVHAPTATVFHDKHLSLRGAYVPSDAEIYHSALAAVLLPTKYSRPDVAEARLGDLDRSPQEVHGRVAAEYRRRVTTGELPVPLDPDGTVAQFQTYAYADLRFDYTF